MRAFIPSFLVVITDQVSKIWIKNSYSLYESQNILGNFLRFTYVENPGLAFGIRVGSLKLVVTIISALIASYLAFLLYNSKDLVYIEKLSLSMILGGAIGNLIDRVIVYIPNSGYDGVVDFIDVGVINHRWYIFNIADSAVTIGIILYLVYSIFFEDRSLVNDAG
mgnify:CR=1 FL=1